MVYKCCKINYIKGERGPIFLYQATEILNKSDGNLLIRQIVIPWKLFLCAKSTLEISSSTQTEHVRKTKPLPTWKKN